MASQQAKPKSSAASEPHPIGLRGYRVRDVARAAERRREILTGAARAFARAGYDATNMDEIARECGLAKSHIYHYFRGKEEIFTEIRIDAVSRAIERLAPFAPIAREDPETALRNAIASIVARIFHKEERYEPMLPDPVSLSPENRKRIRTLGRRYEQMFTDIIRAGIEQGVFVRGDPKLMTFVILRSAFTVANWYRETGKWKPQWIVDQVTAQLLRSVQRTAPSKTG